MLNYYDILKVKTNASPSEIKSAYKRLAFIHHPDRNGGKKDSEESFKNVYEAYKTLSNVTKRRLYDSKLNLYKPSEVQYNYHQGGFYSSIKTPKSTFNFTKSKGFESKKWDLDHYLFWATAIFIISLIAILAIKF